MLAPSSLVSASTRLSAPVCSVLIRFLVKSWRVCTVVRLEPNFEAWVRSVFNATSSCAIAVSMMASDWKPVPLMVVSPRPAVLKVTPAMVSELVPFSLNRP